MQPNAPVAAAILGFAAMAAAHPERHHHAHHHYRRQAAQELPDGQVGFPVSPQPSGQPSPFPTPASVSSWTPQPVSTTYATPTTPSTPKTPGATTLATSQVTSKPQTESTETASNPAQTTGDMTINIVNKYGSPLSLAYGNNAGGPSANGNPSDGTLASSTSVTFPTGWAGRITIGKDGNGAGSKIEGSFSGLPDVDVSYVDGYSVPITCSCSNTPVSGCNLELFDMGSCQTKQDDTCINTISGTQPDGPAMDFFAPCQGAAYTYPNDNDANIGCQGHSMDCCIGTSCDAPARQKVKSS